MNPEMILQILISLLVGSALTVAFFKVIENKRKAKLQEEAGQFLASARRQSETEHSEMLVAAKEAALEAKAESEEELAASRKSQVQREQKLDRRDEQLQQQEDALRKQQRGLESSQTRLATQLKGLAEQREELDSTLKEQTSILEQASGMSREQAGEKLMEAMLRELEHERGSALLKHKKLLDEVVQAQGREILLTAIQRYASAHTSESTTSTVDVPTDDIKGRIIGREGRNIRAFEKATGRRCHH